MLHEYMIILSVSHHLMQLWKHINIIIIRMELKMDACMYVFI